MEMIRNVCLTLAVSSLAASATGRAADVADRRKPNIIFVLADDMGYGDLSCYGGARIKTQNIDRLAAEGIRFTQFCVNAPICSPSRTAFLTGQYPARWHITSYIAARAENEQRGMAQWLDVKAPTVARFLSQAGYRTGHFGKWHMGGGRDVGEAPLPTEYGFNASLTQFEGLGDRVLPIMSAQDDLPERKMPLGVASEKLGRGKVSWVGRSQVTKSFVDGALDFIKWAEKEDKPFYVNVWPDDPHSPFDPPAELRGNGLKKALYGGVVKALDTQLGPLFDYVRGNPKLRDNTLIIFSSDNGHEAGAGSAGPFRGSKGNLYEGGIREPFIVWAPGLMAANKRGSVNETTVLTGIDLLPSLLAIAGVPAPVGANMEGLNLSSSLLGKAVQVRGKPIFWKRPPDRPGPVREPFPDLAVRDADWKLLMQDDGSRLQLYNLGDDAGESKNLAAQHPDIVARLKQSLLAWNSTLPTLMPAGVATDARP